MCILQAFKASNTQFWPGKTPVAKNVGQKKVKAASCGEKMLQGERNILALLRPLFDSSEVAQQFTLSALDLGL